MVSKSIRKKSNRQIRIGMILSYLTIAVGIVTGLVYTPWMLSILGDSDYGIYTIANSVISIFLLDFGLSVAVTRFTARYIEKEDYSSLRMFYGVINKLYFFINCFIFVCFAAMYFLIPFLYQALTTEEIEKLRIVFIMLAAYSIISFQFIPLDGILSAFEEFIAFKACTLLVKLLTVIVTAIFLFYGFGLYSIVACHIVFGLLGIAFKKLYILGKLKITPSYRSKRTVSYKELGSFAGWITVIQLGDRLFLSIIPTLLGAVSGSFEVTVFGLAVTLESFIFSIVNVANSVFFPKVSRTYNSDDEELTSTNNLMIKVGKFQTFISGLIICGFVGLGQPFVTLWSGSNYLSAYIVTLLIIIPVCIEQSQGVPLLVLQVTGRLKEIAVSTIICGIINIGLALSLGYYYGALGAAIALCISKTIKIIYSNFVFVKKGKMKMLNVYKKVYLRFMPSFVLVIVSGLLIAKFFQITSFVYLICFALALTIEYTVVNWFLALTKKERKEMMSMIRNKFKKREKDEKAKSI